MNSNLFLEKDYQEIRRSATYFALKSTIAMLYVVYSDSEHDILMVKTSSANINYKCDNKENNIKKSDVQPPVLP